MDQLSSDERYGYVNSSRKAWYAVFILSILYCLSFIDRLILAIVAQPVAADLRLTDLQMGVLLGAGFAVVYALSGLPIASLIDRGHRIRVIAAGVTLWSIMTMASALAASFEALLFARAGVALGEAALTPAAISLIANMFPADRRAVPTAVYSAMASIMSVGGYIVGGAALAIASALQPITGLASWRMTFLLVGIPGLILALILLVTVREPRVTRLGTATGEIASPNFFQFCRYLSTEWTFYTYFYGGLMLITIIYLGAIPWMPTILMRAHNISASETGYLLGAVGGAAGILSATFWSIVVTYLARRGRPDSVIVGLWLSALIAIAFLIVTMFQTELRWVLVAFFIAMFGVTATAMLAPLALQTYGLASVRARLISLYLLTTYLLGYSIGPLLVVSFSHSWLGEPRALGYGVSITAVILGPLGLAALFGCMKISRRKAVELH